MHELRASVWVYVPEDVDFVVTLLTSLAQPQRRQNREKKSNMLNKQNKNSERTCAAHFLADFFAFITHDQLCQT